MLVYFISDLGLLWLAIYESITWKILENTDHAQFKDIPSANHRIFTTSHLLFEI